MTTADPIDSINTSTSAFCSIDIDLGLDSSTVDVLISDNLLSNPLSELP